MTQLFFFCEKTRNSQPTTHNTNLKSIDMKKANLIFISLILGLTTWCYGQMTSITIPLNTSNWQFKSESVEFLEYKGVKAMKINSSTDQVVLKNFDFTDGTIEFDIELSDPRFSFLHFRKKDATNSEGFYLRTQRAGNPNAVDAIQYAPIIKGVNLWDMLYAYQSNADFSKTEWNHVKLVVSGKQLLAYVNDMTTPALAVPHLEGNTTTGTLAFNGQAIIANLVVKPDVTEGLSPIAGIDITDNDPRYLRKWKVSEVVAMEAGIDFKESYYPTETTTWTALSAERGGLINLTRMFGKSEKRRMVWLKMSINSNRAQTIPLDLGFSDEVWVFINNRSLFIDKNTYISPMRKSPDGRCSIENASFEVPLKEGNNELLIGVANDFFGWGIIGRLAHLDGLTLAQ